MTYHGDLKTINRNANQALNSFRIMQKDFHQEDGHSWDVDQKRCGILLMVADHKENGNRVAELMMMKFGESKHPVFRSTSPLS